MTDLLRLIESELMRLSAAWAETFITYNLFISIRLVEKKLQKMKVEMR